MVIVVIMQYSFILGRNPELSIAELAAVTGGRIEKVKNAPCVFIDTDLPAASPRIFLNELGGSVEILQVFGRNLPLAELQKNIVEFLKKAATRASGKLLFSLNILPENKKFSVLKTLLPRVKKALREEEISCGFANKDFKNVSSVFAFKHGLGSSGTNIWIIDEGESRASLAATVAMQDFESYGARDYGKPFRDAAAGMLPPKLAQIMINLCVIARSEAEGGATKQSTLVCDPFCGTGTILMEAMLMGHSVIGSDSSAKMTTGCEKNLSWLRGKFKIAQGIESKVFHKSATDLKLADLTPSTLNPQPSIVTEPYLGPPLSAFPAPAFLERLMSELSSLYLSFFKNLATWLPKGSPVVFIFPYWKRSQIEKIRLSERLIEKIRNLGYIETAFDLLQTTSLFYERPDQIVGREIVRFIRT